MQMLQQSNSKEQAAQRGNLDGAHKTLKDSQQFFFSTRNIGIWTSAQAKKKEAGTAGTGGENEDGRI
jgi:hypothetical protein